MLAGLVLNLAFFVVFRWVKPLNGTARKMPRCERVEEMQNFQHLPVWSSMLLSTAVGLALGYSGLGISLAFAQDGTAAGSAKPETAVENKLENCRVLDQGATRLMVMVDNIHSEEGQIRVQVYGDNPDEFLAKGAKLVRVDTPVDIDGTEVCVPLPGPGEFALVVMHDRNKNGRADFLTEGFGFSNNPKLGLGQPDYDEVSFRVGPGVTKMDISLLYVFDFEEKKQKRRRRRH